MTTEEKLNEAGNGDGAASLDDRLAGRRTSGQF